MELRADIVPGQRVIVEKELDGSVMALLYDGVPDWVTIPKEIGGGRANVKASETKPCPCGKHNVLTLTLDNGMFVAECIHNGFLFYK